MNLDNNSAVRLASVQVGERRDGNYLLHLGSLPLCRAPFSQVLILCAKSTNLVFESPARLQTQLGAQNCKSAMNREGWHFCQGVSTLNTRNLPGETPGRALLFRKE